ncbi:MAG: hypothetical protein AB7U41_03920 [Dongiaceae bacterium]
MTGKVTNLCGQLGIPRNDKMNRILAEFQAIGISIPEGNHPSFVLTRAMIKEAAQRLFCRSGIGLLKLADKRDRLIKLLDQAGVRLTSEQWNQAALRNNDLFYAQPRALCGNLTGLVKRAKKSGIPITLGSYLAAALRQPALFSAPPEQVMYNIIVIISAYEKEVFRLPDQPVDIKIAKEWLVSYLMRHPALLAQSSRCLNLWCTWHSLHAKQTMAAQKFLYFDQDDIKEIENRLRQDHLKSGIKGPLKLGKKGKKIDEKTAPGVLYRIFNRAKLLSRAA